MRVPWLIAAFLTLGAPNAIAETFAVAPQTVSDDKAVFATVESRNVEPARARIGGTVAALAVKQGDEVDDADEGQIEVRDAELEASFDAFSLRNPWCVLRNELVEQRTP